jgi:tetratricopeptide (TPR) repeat protein
LGDRAPGGDRLPSDRVDNRLPGDRVGDRLPGQGERPGFENRRDQLQDRLDNRGDRQDNRQEGLDNRREDWQDWADDRYHHHGDWHHGYCNGLWDHPLAAWGLTAWGVNRLAYSFGYWGYYNPYYVEPVASAPVYDYSEPLVIVEQPVETLPAETFPGETLPAETSTALPPDVTEPGLAAFDEARAAFRAGNYTQALEHTDRALREMPQDALIHEFRSLVLFALGRYPESAATIYAVLAVGPGWDWTTLIGLYPTAEVYTQQLRALEAHCKRHPDAADARLLLGYHYLTCGHKDTAQQQFQKVVELQPMDTVARQLLQSLGATAPQDTAPQEAQVIPERTIPPEQLLAVDQLAGAWHASDARGSTFKMSLNKDGQFTWSYTQSGKTDEVRGVYALDDNILAMEPESGGGGGGGGTLLAELTKKGEGAIHFAMIGAPEGDPGLEFTTQR